MPQPTEPATITIEVSPGELIDKITILEIKTERLTDAAQLDNVRYELGLLRAARTGRLADSAALAELEAELKSVNERLWKVEDDIRACEAVGDFGPRFVELAREVYRTNDRRAVLKRKIGALFGSKLVEEKSYREY